MNNDPYKYRAVAGGGAGGPPPIFCLLFKP